MPTDILIIGEPNSSNRYLASQLSGSEAMTQWSSESFGYYPYGTPVQARIWDRMTDRDFVDALRFNAGDNSARDVTACILAVDLSQEIMPQVNALRGWKGTVERNTRKVTPFYLIGTHSDTALAGAENRLRQIAVEHFDIPSERCEVTSRNSRNFQNIMTRVLTQAPLMGEEKKSEQASRPSPVPEEKIDPRKTISSNDFRDILLKYETRSLTYRFLLKYLGFDENRSAVIRELKAQIKEADRTGTIAYEKVEKIIAGTKDQHRLRLFTQSRNEKPNSTATDAAVDRLRKAFSK